ncbi:type II secretion system protein GspM [Acidobacteria bacterium AH-259-L09]|nr:type II secretion system protein GspM [Acidobacteria bacterium AH-259-L09]
MKRLAKREKRAVAILGMVGGMILVVFGLVLPFYDAKSELGAEIEKKEKLLQRYIQAIQEEEIYQAQLTELDRVLGQYRQGLLDAQEASIATVQLEEIVRGLAAEYNIQVARSNPLQERKIGEGYAKITLQINLQSDVNQLTNFLHGLSTHSKFLLVDDFSLTSFRSKNQVRIQPRLKVSGFVRLS